MQSRSREFGTATLGGLVVGGVISMVLDIASISFSTAIGALVGGVFAAYLLHGKVGQAAAAGALSGLLGTPLLLGLEQILAIFELIPIPAGPQPSMAELQATVAILVLIDIVAGAVGGAVFSATYHPNKEVTPSSSAPLAPGAPSAQLRYCVQCGAQLPVGATTCPQCNAKQLQ
jgi:hypothetical protein